MMSCAAVTLAFTGFAALALSMRRHHSDLFGRQPTRRVTLVARIFGWLLLAASLAAAIGDAGYSVGMILWCGIATVTALAVALLLTYRRLWWRV